MPEQTVYTQIKLPLKEQFDQSQHYYLVSSPVFIDDAVNPSIEQNGEDRFIHPYGMTRLHFQYCISHLLTVFNKRYTVFSRLLFQ